MAYVNCAFSWYPHSCVEGIVRLGAVQGLAKLGHFEQIAQRVTYGGETQVRLRLNGALIGCSHFVLM